MVSLRSGFLSGRFLYNSFHLDIIYLRLGPGLLSIEFISIGFSYSGLLSGIHFNCFHLDLVYSVGSWFVSSRRVWVRVRFVPGRSAACFGWCASSSLALAPSSAPAAERFPAQPNRLVRFDEQDSSLSCK